MQTLPFPALVGLETAQQALLLLAVEPRLKGVMVAAPAGTGKSSLARGLQALLAEVDPVPFVEIPTSIDAENLLGGLDLNATLAQGALVTRPGILARAHGGFAYVDGIHLMEDGAAHPLMAALDEGELRVEREGLSLRTPARFSLLGSYDPAEGAPRRHLLDRVGLLVRIPGTASVAERTEVVTRNLFPDPEGWQEESELLKGIVAEARAQLPEVTITPEQVVRLSRLALAHGVEGHRVDLFAVAAARAAAALELRDAVEEEDLLLAAQLVILPRATQRPEPQDEPEPAPPPPPPPSPPEDAADPTPPPPPPEAPENTGEEDEARESPQPPSPDPLGAPPEQVFEALMGELPQDLESLAFLAPVKRSRAGSRGATAGKRGRHVRSLPGDPGRQRLDTLATLRAAAPWQEVRGRDEGERVLFRPEDVRVKQYRSKAGALFILAVDASGSMALHRMRQAKGAVHALLQKAYVKRDRVALLAFRGEAAETLMPPSQSVELARRALDVLPTGGGTPLASALLEAERLAAQARARGIQQAVLILLTDGRGNVPFKAGADPREELRVLSQSLSESPLRVVVVDTQRSYLSRGEARQLAEWIGGEYAYLPGATGEAIAALAEGVAG